MSPTLGGLSLARGLCLATLLLTPSAFAQSVEDAFYKAHYLQHESEDLDEALKLYEQIARHGKSSSAWRAKAELAIAEIREDLACSDFTRLMPAETIFYAELNHPGDRLGGLLHELGLLTEEGGAPGLGLSPKLLDAALDLRGAALAITEIDPGGGPPNGVLVLHPGNQDALRGLIETAVGNGGQSVEAIHGSPTWSLEGEALVCFTRRLMVAGRDRAHIAGVLERLHGKRKDSFAGAHSMQSAHEMRADDLMFFHLNAEPVMPMLLAIMEEEAKRDPEVAMARMFLDPESLIGVSGRVGVSQAGLGLDLVLELEEGHQNLAFNLMRTPPIEDDTLRDIPSGVAFFMATSLNRPGPALPSSGEEGRPIVTAMDFGREVFANIVDVTVYGMTPKHSSSNRQGMPDVVASISVNDAQRSRALWNFVLNLVAKSSGQAANEAAQDRIAGHDVERYTIEGIPVYLYTGDRELLISPSRDALAHTFAARKSNSSVLDDPLFASSLESLGSDRNMILLASPARCARIAQQFAPKNEVRELEQVAEVFQDTVICIGMGQSATTFDLSARVANVPNVSPLLSQWLQQQRGGGVARGHSAPVAAPAVAAAVTSNKRLTAEQVHSNLTSLLAQNRLEQARATVQARAKALQNDPNELNALAWMLLTETPYNKRFDDLALTISERSNEASSYSSWALIDTLALANFRAGQIEQAVTWQRRALELAQGSGREAEVKKALARYEAAMERIEARQASSASGR